MWGKGSDGCAIYEYLPTGIRHNLTYRIKCMVRFDSTTTAPNARLRFLAFNRYGSGIPWQTSKDKITVIGTITINKKSPFTQYFTADWIADADYGGLEIDCQSDNSNNSDSSSIDIDDVELQEKQ
jgi:hypothetical protein